MSGALPDFEEVEHTADWALRVRGADLREALDEVLAANLTAPYGKTTQGDTQQSKDRFITEVYGFKRSVTRAAKEMAPTIDLGNLEQLVRLGDAAPVLGNAGLAYGTMHLTYAFISGDSFRLRGELVGE